MYQRGLLPPKMDDEEKVFGATLEEKEIVEKIEKGEIKSSELTISQRERLGIKMRIEQ
jgi:cyclophilin family peptidyl-prolyl cis-trans isomerase